MSRLRAYLGLVNYRADFYPDWQRPRHHCINSFIKGVRWSWKEEGQHSSNQKIALQSDNLLVHYDFKIPLTIVRDALPLGVGVVLSHKYMDGIIERLIA